MMQSLGQSKLCQYTILYDALDPHVQQCEQTKAYENEKKTGNLDESVKNNM